MSSKKVTRLTLPKSGRETQLRNLMLKELERKSMIIEEVQGSFKRLDEFEQVVKYLKRESSTFKLKYFDAVMEGIGSDVELEIEVHDMIRKENKIFLISTKPRGDEYRQIIKSYMDVRRLELHDLSSDFRSSYEFYNFRDLMEGKTSVCSINFFEYIMRRLKCEVKITVIVKG